ncbi:helix-turn-helix transcriptional regulator [Streptomyces sp. ASQP_92]|uniref:PadR family transcriptional regulator n=1 Tax=Streptomyces sp. ASQP_92 TaxID=2979116 RepID=UPI0021C0A783|nr:PadR family transcriptional regulator [Streptomyces sp. ASQP_92]MCT9090901.1 helix-turn-helix transcriptional regulator [Streptomyces sp. ASQP_92]
MPPVFAHGRLRLYLLKLLDEAPRHGYEVIRLLEERFQGLYAPSAGTVYPRLAKLEAEGLVTHTTEGGRKVYSITEAGRAELAGRGGELADLELEIRESVSELAAEIRDDVRGAAGSLREDMRRAAREARTGQASAGAGRGARKGFPEASDFFDSAWGDGEAWQQAKEEFKRAKQEWKEQARRAKDESRRARDEAQQARRQAKEAQEKAREEMQRVARDVQRQVQEHFARGDWPTGVREGLAEITKELGRFGFGPAPAPAPGSEAGASSAADVTVERVDLGKVEAEGGAEPEWAREEPSGNPARDLDRLLDRFRDDIRDAARDHGVTPPQLLEARRHLAEAAVRIGGALRPPGA